MSVPWLSFGLFVIDVLLFISLCIGITLLEIRQTRLDEENDRQSRIDALRLRTKLLSIVYHKWFCVVMVL